MKKRELFISWIVLLTVSLSSCHKFDSNSIYLSIRDHTDKIKVIDTHEHQHLPSEYGHEKFLFNHFLMSTYLYADLVSSGAKINPDSVNGDNFWNAYGKSLDFTRTTSYYSHLIAGLRLLYDFREPYLTEANVKELAVKLEKNYLNYDEWFDKSFRKAGYERMIIDQYWKPMNTEIDTVHYALAFNIGFLVSGASGRPFKKPGVPEKIALQNSNFTLDDYLKICDDLFRKNIEKKAVCIKNAQAYSRTLRYEDVPYEKAAKLFKKDELNPAEAKAIEDFMFHYMIREAIRYNLPIQIHTGYLAGNGGILENGRPENLNNLFLQYPEAKFILFHGGFPWTGEWVALAKMFPNVYLDLVWLPQISRQEAINTFDVMLDCVPYNKICWGGDCQLIEESVGALDFAKDVVSEVLTLRIKRGLLTENVAKEIADRIFRENAKAIFNLNSDFAK